MAIFNFRKNILLEAEKETIEVEENDNVDYTEDVETPEDTETTDDETQTEEETTDDTETDEPIEDEGTDEGDDTTDYTEDIADDTAGTDDMTGEESPEETSEEPTTEEPSEDDIKNANLLKDIITLYYEVINITNKIDNIIDINFDVNQVCVKVKNNLTTLNEYLYDLVTGPFKANTYVKNLYIYQYALEIVKINIEMFRNIKDFNSM